FNRLNEQEGLYTLFLRRVKEGKVIEEKHLISNIVKAIDPYTDFEAYLDLAKEEHLEFIISNTTEAGIAYDENDTAAMCPPNSFPAKLTLLLYERFKHFDGDASKGLTIIPCELINYNADTLKKIILQYIELWQLGSAFSDWVLKANSFHNTLVDRIVPGYPKDSIEEYNFQLEYEDKLIVTAENFFLWVIEGDEALKQKLPFEKTRLDVKIVADMQPYRTRKVRILNGAHTAMVPFSILYGNETVKETIDDPFTGKFISETVFEEIIPTLDMDKEELEQFAIAVFDRFRNPFIKHLLSSIALNSISKFKVRVLPSLLGYVEQKGTLPKRLTYAFAALIEFYNGKWQGNQLPVNDGAEEIAFFGKAWELTTIEKTVAKVLSNTAFWDTDLTRVKGLKDAITMAIQEMEANGIEAGYATYSVKLKV
ncbi:MAG: tagaturonate reductase, partial [Flavobacteriaceae bacterium]|nr:tagaturonate reductase [Flavobacteriaceae bacterium]